MKKYYFTFGQTQVHSVGGRTYDKNTIVEISANDFFEARKIMFDYFGAEWCFQYENYEDLNLKKYWSFYNIIDVVKNQVTETYNKFSEANNYE